MSESKCKSDAVQWLQSVSGCQVSEFGEKVADILDQLFDGIYHIQEAVVNKRVRWDDPSRIQVVLYGSMSTYDFSRLTHLVLLAHRYCVRVEISGSAPGYLRILFSDRKREGAIYSRHPTIEQAIENFNNRYPEVET